MHAGQDQSGKAFPRAVAALALLASIVVGLPRTASVHAAEPAQPLVGDFDGDGWDDVLWYRPGLAADEITWAVASEGPTTTTPARIVGTYHAMVGDFDGNGFDDVFWHAGGSAPDYLWSGRADRSFTSISLQVTGHYDPFAGDFDGDGSDDVFWYRPGPAPDYLWWGGTSPGSFRSTRTQVQGSYVPLVGEFDIAGQVFRRADDILWYGPGGTPDSIWVFPRDRAHVSHATTVTGWYEPVVGDFDGNGRSDVMWHGPGESRDYLWSGRGDLDFSSRSLHLPQQSGATVAHLGRDHRSDVFFSPNPGAPLFGDDSGFAEREDTSVVHWGNSLAFEARDHLRDAMAAGPGSAVSYDTGFLGGTAVCDWLPTIRRRHPDLAVLGFTGNAQTPCMQAAADGGRSAVLEQYRSDLSAAADALGANGTAVMLVGPPPIRDHDLADLRAVMMDVATSRAWVDYEWSGAAVTDEGSYTDRLPCRPFEGPGHGCVDGSIRVRNDDGVHFCPASPSGSCPPTWSSGAHRYANAIVAAISEQL